MKVLHVSSAGPDTGAGAAALLTHEALLRDQRVDSRILFLTQGQVKGPAAFSFEAGDAIRRIRRRATTAVEQLPLVRYRGRDRRVLFSPGLIGLPLQGHELFAWADVVHLHWVNHGFVDVEEVARWNRPVVWSLRDMWALTGGCHHSLGCLRFAAACGQCPVLGSRQAEDISTVGLRRKQKSLTHAPITWVAISSWMARMAQTSRVVGDAPIHVIPSGIPTTRFTLRDRDAARARFGVPVDATVVLIGAADLADPYKGADYVIDAMRRADPRLVVVAFGRSDAAAFDIPQQVVRLGHLADPSDLEAAYNCANVFLAPARAESFGKTVAEAQACGIPAVAFGDTGAADIISHRETGYVAAYADVDDLSRGLEHCLTTPFDRDTIRARAVRLFDVAVSADAYTALYASCGGASS